MIKSYFHQPQSRPRLQRGWILISVCNALAENLMDEADLETIYFKFKDMDMELGDDRKKELEESIAGLMV